ncbi:ribonuclease P protein component [Petrotoga mobilis SJ95]|jgi:ribonuclease P protein component|uniref:Ribonuclease P protein component n=1 Tax=Petrotoga mobilis (strain DSM 10674 / SJ95) TaxID=403833 RepID=RNPA_PETMO|nr:ribonuclease P protein component [Petrotoga mobilis]A9BJC4.1 RecName: Full=Ribonuclease P protein component; Short=RNase P protein; Short=RNaseP protein; AltName: Full=Protein C5 [Petrotoga mobilis SJ95]ABX31338.1 ribonuclease P protein component [Petrotoga mobilis SJ95]
MEGQTFKKKERLRLKRNFKNVFEKGGRLIDNNFVIIYVPNTMDYNRIAVIVNRKFGNAVVRNLIKRYIREIYRTNKTFFPLGYDFVFIPRKELSKNFKGIDYSQIKNQILKLVRKLEA